jgi:tetratricopeptide (TPR) repeat protein
MRLRRSFLMLLGMVAVMSGPASAGAPSGPPAAAADSTDGDRSFRAHDVRGAEAAWKAALAAHPGDGELHERLGALFEAQGRLAESIAQETALLPNPVAARALVRLHARAGDLPAFLDATALAADHDRFDSDALAVQATVLQATHHEAQALTFYSRVVELRRGGCPDLIARAGDLVALHRIDDAVADLRRCLTLEPASYDALASLGAAYLLEHDDATARWWNEQALAADPSGVQALVNRGVLEDDAGDTTAAMRDDEAAIAADPLRSEGYANLAYDLLDRQALTAAEVTLEDGLRAVPGDGRLHFLLGRTYQLEGRDAASARAQYVAALDSDEDVVVRAARSALGALPATR